MFDFHFRHRADNWTNFVHVYCRYQYRVGVKIFRPISEEICQFSRRKLQWKSEFNSFVTRVRHFDDQSLGWWFLNDFSIIFESFLWNDLIKWVGTSICPLAHLLPFRFFNISSISTGLAVLKFHWMILDMGQHNRSVPGFAISETYPNKLIFLRRGSPAARSLARLLAAAKTRRTPQNLPSETFVPGRFPRQSSLVCGQFSIRGFCGFSISNFAFCRWKLPAH